MKGNLKTKIISSILAIIMLTSMSTMCFATEVIPEEETKIVYKTEDIKLFDTVYFTGNTYRRDLLGRDKVRGTYEQPEFGIITVKNKNKEHSLHINGKGWIAPEQITEKVGTYIELNFNKINNGLKSTLKVNGEFVKIESTNNAILSMQNGEIKLGANGTTTLKITTDKGEIVNIDAKVDNGVLALNIPDGKFEATLEGAQLTLTSKGEEIASIEGSGSVSANVELNDNGITANANGIAQGAITVKGEEVASIEGSGNASANVLLANNGITANANGIAQGAITVKGQEVLSGSASLDQATAAISLEGISGEAQFSQQLSVLAKIKAKMTEQVELNINSESAGIGGAVQAEVGDKQVLQAAGSTEYTYQTDNLNVQAEAYNKPIINKDIKVIETIKGLLNKIALAIAVAK